MISFLQPNSLKKAKGGEVKIIFAGRMREGMVRSLRTCSAVIVVISSSAVLSGYAVSP